jgi:quercetin 2,3-dioxygenase
MLQKIDLTQKRGNSHIQILYPGEVLQNGDTGLGTLGRIDHANINGGTTIRMHPHVNDDILSYFRVGNVKHTDSAGITEYIGRNKLMLMKSGKVFYHEEQIIDKLEGLQIFIRPKEKDAASEVLFYQLQEADSINEWRLLASPESTPLRLSSQTWIFDAAMDNAKEFTMPALPSEKLTLLLYVFEGSVNVNADFTLEKGEAVIIKEETVKLITNKKTELVLFVTDEASSYFDKGAFSGNQFV